jgi:hypothetical protein
VSARVSVRPGFLNGSICSPLHNDSESSHIFVHKKFMGDQLGDRLSGNFEKKSGGLPGRWSVSCGSRWQIRIRKHGWFWLSDMG